jgi:hypothetical protein
MLPDLLARRLPWLGGLALVICAITWGMDLTGLVYVCPYCRVQRTVIGLLGVAMLLPDPRHWLVRYLATVLGVLGLVVAVMHFFPSLKEVLVGEFSWDDPWYLDSFLLSGCALCIITGQLLLLYQPPPTDSSDHFPTA